jgi:hypothetical protein
MIRPAFSPAISISKNTFLSSAIVRHTIGAECETAKWGAAMRRGRGTDIREYFLLNFFFLLFGLTHCLIYNFCSE